MRKCSCLFLAAAMSLALLPTGAMAQEEEPAQTTEVIYVESDQGQLVEIDLAELIEQDETEKTVLLPEESAETPVLWEEPVETEPELTLDEVSLSGTFKQTEARSMLALINSFRTGDQAWYWNADDTTKTVYNQAGGKYLKELTYDYDLEQIAMQRAIEIVVSFSHTRPNGELCFSLTYNGTGSWAENIAKGQRSVSAVFTAWQETNESYSGQGHRRSMLSIDYTAVGIACFTYGGKNYWVQEFGVQNSGASETTAVDGVVVGSTDTTSYALLGDINGDNTVDLKDVTVLFQYVNRQIDDLKNQSVADVNKDGSVTLKDVTQLFQYVNKQITSL